MKQTKLLLALFIIHFVGFAQDLDYAKQIVNTLSSPEFKGRGFVENGDQIAAKYIADEFQSMGLLPVNGKSYFQHFNVSLNTLPGKVFLQIDDVVLKPAVDYLIDPLSPSVKGKFPVTTISRKEIDTEENVKSILSQLVGSFLLIDARDKSNETQELSKAIDENIKSLANIPCENLKGIILLTDEKLMWRGSRDQVPQNIRPLVTMKKDIDPGKIKMIDIRVDAKYLKDYKTQNVVASIQGSTEPDSMIVVTAHYDHIGKMGKNVYFPGANDNASGVAMVLNLAKHYSQAKPKFTMVFIALTGEEFGLLGSKAFVANPLIDLQKIKFLINFDMAGTGEDGIKIVNGTVFSKQFYAIKHINDDNDLVPSVNIRGESCNSDHCPFYQQGVPSFFIYTMGGISAYHDIYDRFETLPFTEFTDYCTLMIKFFDTF